MSEERIINIELKITDMEDQVDEMNKTIFRQQQQIDQLIHAFQSMVKRLEALSEANEQGSPADDIPPHY